MNAIILNKLNESSYEVRFGPNSAYLGTFDQDVDGYFYYWPSNKGGCFAGHDLISIGEKLEEINKPWNDKIDEDFKSFYSVPNPPILNDEDEDDLPF